MLLSCFFCLPLAGHGKVVGWSCSSEDWPEARAVSSPDQKTNHSLWHPCMMEWLRWGTSLLFPLVWPGQILEWTCFRCLTEWGLAADPWEKWGGTLFKAGIAAEQTSLLLCTFLNGPAHSEETNCTSLFLTVFLPTGEPASIFCNLFPRQGPM